MGRFDEAARAYHQALHLQPDFPEAHNNLGIVLAEQGRLEEAGAAYTRALQLRPDYGDAENNLGLVLVREGRYDEAIAAYRRALKVNPDNPETNNNLGLALQEQGALNDAALCFQRVLDVNPQHPEALLNFGLNHWRAGRFQDVERWCREAISLRQDFANAHFNLGMLLLLFGRYEEGWREYEWRWRAPEFTSPRPRFSAPQWDGSRLNGQCILIHAEQGLGDSIQFIRYAPLVAQLGGRVIVECEPELKTLFASFDGISQVIAYGEPLPDVDVHCPMMSLPLAFGTRMETIPYHTPYLRADPLKAVHWRERLNEATTLAGRRQPSPRRPLKIGLIWAGGARPHQPDVDRIDRRRSMRLSQFAPLAAAPGVVFVSLQKGPPAMQAQTPPEGMTLLDWTNELQDFADTAALVEALDLVISVDTAVAHLAGALGKPVWMLNRFDTCWRWLLNRTDSPWYPTMRLFRQPTAGEWDLVIAEVCAQLRAFAQTPANS